MRHPAEMNRTVTIMPIVPSWCVEKLTFTHLLLHNTLGRYTGCRSMLMNRFFITTMASVYWIIFLEMCIVHHILSTWISVACSRHKARHWNLTRGIILYNTSAIRCWPSLFYWDRKSTRLNSSHVKRSRMPSSAWKKKILLLNKKLLELI